MRQPGSRKTSSLSRLLLTPFRKVRGELVTSEPPWRSRTFVKHCCYTTSEIGSRASRYEEGLERGEARNFLAHVADRDDRPGYLLRDRDRKFTRQFDDIMNASGVKPKLLPFRSPNLKARCERVIQTLKQECLDFFLVFGSRHLDYLISEFVEYYNTTRSHSRRDHLPPLRQDLPDEHKTVDISEIVCRERLGGLIKSFERVAA